MMTGGHLACSAPSVLTVIVHVHRTVYFAKAGNAARLAASLPASDLEELPRIASGEAKQISSGIPDTATTTADNVTTGLQGTVVKPIDRTSGI